MSQLITEPLGPPAEVPRKHRWYLRAWFIVPAVLAVAAAAVLAVLLALPKTITVHGTVVDQMRPDLGVAAATLKADGKAGKTDATGSFTMTGVARDAKLQVTAPAYNPGTVSASTHQMTIKLVPIPVSVTVTSAMTGAPLKATITAPPGAPAPYTAASGSAVRVYRAAPGETMTVSAPGYVPASKTVGSDRTLAVVLQPGAVVQRQQIAAWVARGQYTKVVDWVLRPGIGHTFVAPTAREQAEMNKMLEQDPTTLYITGRTVPESDAWVGISIDSAGSFVDIPATMNDMFGHADRVMLAGHPAWHGGPDSQGVSSTMARAGVIELQVFGSSVAQTDQIMTDILRPLAPGTGSAA